MSNLRLSGGENYIPSAEIKERVQELGAFYTDLYAGEPLVIISLISGAARFAIHLAEAIKNQRVEEIFYRTRKMDGIRSSGGLFIDGVPDVNIKGRNVLVVEDMDHTRETLAGVSERLKGQEPKRLDLACLLNNAESPKLVDTLPFDTINYAFETADVYSVGFGLDWDELYRNMLHISATRNIAGPGERELLVPIVPDEYAVTARG